MPAEENECEQFCCTPKPQMRGMSWGRSPGLRRSDIMMVEAGVTNTHLGSGSLPILSTQCLGAATFLAAFILGHPYVEEVHSCDRKYRMDQNTHQESFSAAPCASSMLISRMKCHYRPDILLNTSTELQMQSRSSTGPRSHPTQEPWEPEWSGGSSYR